MIVLDTDHLTILGQDTIEGFTLGSRLASHLSEGVYVTIITYEEQMRGWLSYVSKAASQTQQVAAYEKLHRHIDQFRSIPLLDYDSGAATVFEQQRKNGVRVGSMDLKIAAIALAVDALLLTRNLKDFQKVPGLRVEDWTL